MESKGVPPPYDSGFVNPSHGQPLSQFQQAPVMVQPQAVHHTSTSVTVNTGNPGGCPVCHNRNWTGTYSCCAWLWCICCFPCGLICCLCMRNKKCTKCGFVVSS